MHTIVTEQPEYRSIAKERDRLERARLVHAKRVAEAAAKHKHALEQHAEADRAAMLAGKIAPERPEYQRPPGDARVFVQESFRLTDAEERFLRDQADRLEEQLAGREDHHAPAEPTCRPLRG